MKHRFAAATVLICTTAALAAAELPDCKLEAGGLLGPRVRDRMRTLPDAATSLNVVGNLRNGENLTFAKDDPVIVADLKATRTRTVLVPTADVSLKSSWALSFSFSFPARICRSRAMSC